MSSCDLGKIMKKVKQLKFSIQEDLKWLRQDGININEKIGYILRKYAAFTKRSKFIKYLGNDIESDNVATPVTLQGYPAEIYELDEHVNFRNPCAILDIGANIGQFSITLATLFPKTRIYSFEANPDIFVLLQKNTKNLPNIVTFNVAVGPNRKMAFYYVPGKSGKGSFILSNAVINLDAKDVKKIEIDSVELTEESCQSLGIPIKFDLIKIDVEGFEYQVLNSLKEIKTRYLVLEYSVGRESGYEFIDLLKRLESMFGRIKIVFCEAIDEKKRMGNMLIQCMDVDDAF
jgi:FkbM family methyltransferase